MDRLDSWLNAQRGWRRDALLLLNVAPLTIMLCAWTWSWTGRTGWTGWTGWVAVPVALGTLLLCAFQTANAYENAYETATRRHWNGAFGAANIIAAVVFLVLVLSEFRYVRRMSRHATVEGRG